MTLIFRFIVLTALIFVFFPFVVYSSDNNFPTVAAPTPQTMSFDQYMQNVVRNIMGSPAFTSDLNPIVKVEGHLVLYVGILAIGKDSERFKKLYETGIWESPNGPIYDFGRVSMTFPDGKVGVYDAMAGFLGGTSLRFSIAALPNGSCSAALSQNTSPDK
jgi:hypothetical protein